jgi:DNA-binding transcriptional ArsR family regulator
MTQTFAVSIGLFDHRARMGSAIWVYLRLVALVTSDEPDGQGDFDGIVLRGEPIPARRLARELGESISAVRSHLRRLEREGYIRRKHGAGESDSYLVTKSKRWLPKRNGTRTERTASPIANGCTPPARFLPEVVQKPDTPGTENYAANKEGIEDISIDTHRTSSPADALPGATPEDLPPTALAVHLVELLGIPMNPPLLAAVGESIRVKAVSERVSAASAHDFILRKAVIAKRDGPPNSWLYWFRDARYDQKTKQEASNEWLTRHTEDIA